MDYHAESSYSAIPNGATADPHELGDPRGDRAPATIPASRTSLTVNGPTQRTRFLGLNTSLDEDVLLLTGVKGREQLSGLFTFRLEMLSLDHAIDPQAMIGTQMSFRIGLPDDEPRYFNGYAIQFSAGKEDREYRSYEAVVVPWMWFLKRTTDCRIFQEKTAPEIVTEIFGDSEFGSLAQFHLNGVRPAEGYRRREYCVQYRETDFDFVNRLLEEEGIFYYFTHDAGEAGGTHSLVLANERHAPLYCAQREVDLRIQGHHDLTREGIFDWQCRRRFISGSFSHDDYDYHAPATDLTAWEASIHSMQAGSGGRGRGAPQPSGADRLEIYEYPGGHDQLDDGRQLARIRMQEEEARHDVITASSNYRSFTAGGRFVLTNHQRLLGLDSGSHMSEDDRTFLITSIRHEAQDPAPDPRTRSSQAIDRDYRNHFECIPASVVYRPRRKTRKPTVRGTQTAMVVGPEGSEIHTDGCGRVKVQFHWDRRGEFNHSSSCWIRVAQIWAGKRWGAHFWPRVGQEVVVSYLEGDPDRPLIVGSVYNDDHMPPYELPECQTLSGIKTNTTPDGDGFNELRFEDRKDCEQLFIHAQRRMDQRVRGSLYETNGGNREIRVGSECGGDLNTYVHHDVNHHTVDNEYRRVETDKHLKVEGDAYEVYAQNRKVGVAQTLMVEAGDMIVQTERDISHRSSRVMLEGGQEVSVRGNMLLLEASQGISLKVGNSCINIEPTGITIQAGEGGQVRINSGGGPAAATPAHLAESFGITLPIDAAAASTAVPGCCGGGRRGGGGGGGGRQHQTETFDPPQPAAYEPYQPPAGRPPIPSQPGTDVECAIVSALSRCEHGRMAEEDQTLQVVPSEDHDHDLIELAADVQDNCGEHAEWTISGSDESPQQGTTATFKAYPPEFSSWWTPTISGRSYRGTASACNGSSRSLSIEAFPPQQLSGGFTPATSEKLQRLIRAVGESPVGDIIGTLVDEPHFSMGVGSATADCGWREHTDHRAFFGYKVDVNFDPLVSLGARIDPPPLRALKLTRKLVRWLRRSRRSRRVVDWLGRMGDRLETVLGDSVQLVIRSGSWVDMHWHRNSPDQELYVPATGLGLGGDLTLGIAISKSMQSPTALFGPENLFTFEFEGTIRFRYGGRPFIDSSGFGLRDVSLQFMGLHGKINLTLLDDYEAINEEGYVIDPDGSPTIIASQIYLVEKDDILKGMPF